MTIKTDTEKMRATLHWAIGIMISLMIIIVGSFVGVSSQTNRNEEDIDKIKKDYLPYFAFEYIIESNNRLINVVTAIDSKDDPKYQQAMKEWNELQQEVIKQVGLSKRGGTSTASNSSSQ